jgi:uncharacterized membrane protein
MFLQIAEEVGRSFVLPPAEFGFEDAISNLILWIKLIVELIGALLIALGAATAFVGLTRVLRRPTERGYEKTRLVLARFLSLGLEFQLAADILATTVSPTWTQLGQLGAIAVIRTGLNFFLAREMKEEEEAVDETAGEAEVKIKP